MIVRRACRLADSGAFEDGGDIEAYLRIVEGRSGASLALRDEETRGRLDRRCLSSRIAGEAA
jgi:hypothetical protein